MSKMETIGQWRGKKYVILITVVSLFIFAFPAFAIVDEIGCKTACRDRHFPDSPQIGGFHFERKYKLHSYGSDRSHPLPSHYVVAVPKEQERKTLPEHLMVGVTSAFNSRYVSRELPFSRGPVWQPSATVELYGFGFNVWSNFVINDEPNQGQFNEIDFTPHYTAHIGNLSVHPYFMFGIFPNSDNGSLNYTPASVIEGNIYLEYSLWKFVLFGRMRARIKETAGRIYANVGTGFNHHFKKDLAIKTSILLNMGNDKYLSAYYNVMDTNIDALAFMVAVPCEPIDGFTLMPNVNFVVHMVPEIRRAIRQNPNFETYMVWGGINISYDF